METLNNTVKYINDNIIWGPIMLALLIGAGLILSIVLGFPQFRRFG